MFEFFKSSLKDAAVVARTAVIVAVPMTILLFHVWNEYRIVSLGYEIADVTREHRAMLEENKKLSIEAAVQGRTERIAMVARERFGLEQVRAHQVVTIRLTDIAPPNPKAGVEHASLDY
ncbi:MAG: cell division protein FtsL [Bradymonadaceae bacterium]|nr:cell division protein FtsL [Lujinxingiaceae bacterium]